MNYLFLEYPKCTTCQKAKKWLKENKVSFQERNIVDNSPTKEELREWIIKSKLPIKKFFNTSGLKYKELKLKDKLEKMEEEEKLEILASDGMLIKRPLLVGENKILVGFKPLEWEDKI